MFVGILVALAAAVPAWGTSPISEKQAEAAQVFGQIQQLDESLSRADERVNLANLRLGRVEHDLRVNRYELKVAKRNLGRSRDEIAKRLVSLYTTPQSSTLEVILGAKSLDDILTGVDNEHRVSSLDTSVINQVEKFQGAVNRHGRALERERVRVKQLVAQRRAEEDAIRSQLAERQQLLASIKDEIGRLEAEQRARELQAAQRAQEQIAAAQSAQAAAAQDSVVGASAVTPEGATVIPPSSHGGVVGVAMSFLGTPYVWGGASPGGFDCSGLVVYAYGQLGISLPHSSYALWDEGVPVPQDQLQPGDLVFFDGLGHVGIYVGGGDFIHAPHTGDVVRISSLADGSYAGGYVGARRIL